MRIPLVAGRGFDARDDRRARPRGIISQSLAASLFGSSQPIGREISLPGTDMVEVVGVVGDVAHRALDEARTPTIYVSAWQTASASSVVVARADRPQAELVAIVQDEVGRLDAALPVYRVRSLEDVVAASPGVPARRVLTATFLSFALLAVALCAIGLFGILAHEVAARRKELALRVAMGADPKRIIAATAGRSAFIVGAGVAIGGVMAIWASRLLGSAGFTAGRLDAFTLLLPLATLVIAAMAATLPPARRAATTDPVIVLRGD
jgi:hypothetical protein